MQNGFDFGQTINFRYIGMRTVTNSTDVNYRATKQIGFLRRLSLLGSRNPLHDGLRYSGIRELGGSDSYHVSNHLHAGVLGVRFRPWKPFSISLDGEIGRANFPLTPGQREAVSQPERPRRISHAARAALDELPAGVQPERAVYVLDVQLAQPAVQRQRVVGAEQHHLLRRELHEAASGYARRHRVLREHRNPAAIAVGVPVVLHEQYPRRQPRASGWRCAAAPTCTSGTRSRRTRATDRATAVFPVRPRIRSRRW